MSQIYNPKNQPIPNHGPVRVSSAHHKYGTSIVDPAIRSNTHQHSYSIPNLDYPPRDDIIHQDCGVNAHKSNAYIGISEAVQTTQSLTTTYALALTTAPGAKVDLEAMVKFSRDSIAGEMRAKIMLILGRDPALCDISTNATSAFPVRLRYYGLSVNNNVQPDPASGSSNTELPSVDIHGHAYRTAVKLYADMAKDYGLDLVCIEDAQEWAVQDHKKQVDVVDAAMLARQARVVANADAATNRAMYNASIVDNQLYGPATAQVQSAVSANPYTATELRIRQAEAEAQVGSQFAQLQNSVTSQMRKTYDNMIRSKLMPQTSDDEGQ
tara:strand:- start:17330 stop:18304 length:975 start_codon:yes stop_codon:yes gene_type:complete